MNITTEYRNFLRDTSWYTHSHEHNAAELAYLCLGLAGESGEFIDVVKKVVREVGFTDDESFQVHMQLSGVRGKLISELGDVLWYLTRIADFLNLTLEELMISNTHKLYQRLLEKGKINEKDTPWPFPAEDA